jgi:hypothetical protein
MNTSCNEKQIFKETNKTKFSSKTNLDFEERSKNVTDYLIDKFEKKRYINLYEINNYEIEIPKQEIISIKDIKVEENKFSLRQELPNLLIKLKNKIRFNSPKIMIQNKYKLFLENYDK